MRTESDSWVVGKEGPLVHISCCVGNIVSRLFLKFECNEGESRSICHNHLEWKPR
jgi:H+/Cl- antiporter ClcA